MNSNQRLVYSTETPEAYIPTSDDYRLAHRAHAARIADKQKQERDPDAEVADAMNSWCKRGQHRRYLNQRTRYILENY